MSPKGKPSFEDRLEGGLARTKAKEGAAISFPDFLRSPDYAGPFNATVGVSPIVLAVAEASEGRAPTRIDEATCQRIFRCSRTALATGVIPQTMILGAGRGGGKTSALLAPKAVHAAWTVPCPFARPGQELAAVLMAPTLYQAEEGFRYVKGLVEASPVLSRCEVDRSEARGLQFIALRRPDGLVVRVEVKAASAKGQGTRAPTLVFFGADEAAFFADESGARNDRAQYEAALGSFRNNPAVQAWLVSSPWVEGEGLMEELIRDYWGSPSQTFLVAARVSTYDLKGLRDDGSERPRFGRDEDAYRREILAIPLPAGSTSFFNGQAVARALARIVGGIVLASGAGGDIGLVRDLSASAVMRRHARGLFSVTRGGLVAVDARSDGLRASEVADRLAAPLRAAGITSLCVDGHAFAAMSEHWEQAGVYPAQCPVTPEFKIESWTALRDLIDEDRLGLGELDPEVREWLALQFRQVAAKRTAGRKTEILIPRQTARQEAQAAARGMLRRGHADAVAAMVLAATEVGSMRREDWDDKPSASETHGDDYGARDDAMYDRRFDHDYDRWGD